MKFALTRPCDECPWRRDALPGRFPPERYHALLPSVQQGFGPMFACHKTPEHNMVACAGYLLSPDSLHNLLVRMNIGRSFDPAAISSDVPMFERYREMAASNGCIIDEKDIGDDRVAETLHRLRAMVGR